MYVSCVQHYNLNSVYTTPPKVYFPSITLKLTHFTYFALPYTLPFWYHRSVLCIYVFLFYFFDCFGFLKNIPHEWNHTVFVFLWLISLSIISSSSVNVLANGEISSFLWLSSIPLCACMCVYIYTYVCIHTHVYIYIFIHTPHFIYPFIHQ